MHSSPSHLVGEIIQAFSPSEENNYNKIRWEYTVKIYFNGTVNNYPRAIILEKFSGYDDFEEFIVNSTNGINNSNTSESSVETKKRIGSKCLVCFLNGNTSMPVILGFLPHLHSNPSENKEKNLNKPILIDSILNKQQYRARLNGFNTSIDDIGQARLQFSGISLLTSKNEFINTIEHQDNKYKTTMDFLDKGLFRLVDGKSQGIVIDREKEYLSINNIITTPSNVFKKDETIQINRSTEEKPKGLEILLNTKNKDIGIFSESTLSFKTGDDWKALILKSFTLTVNKNWNFKIIDDIVGEVGKSFTMKISNNMAVKSNNLLFENKKTAFTVDKFKVTNSQGELLSEVSDALDKIMDALDTIATSTTITIMGPQQLLPAAVNLPLIKAQIGVIKGKIDSFS